MNCCKAAWLVTGSARTGRFPAILQRVNKFTLGQTLEAGLTLALEFLGWEESECEPTTVGVTYAPSRTFDWNECTVKVNHTEIDLESLELVNENALDADHHKLGANLRKAITRKEVRKVSGKLEGGTGPEGFLQPVPGADRKCAGGVMAGAAFGQGRRRGRVRAVEGDVAAHPVFGGHTECEGCGADQTDVAVCGGSPAGSGQYRDECGVGECYGLILASAYRLFDTKHCFLKRFFCAGQMDSERISDLRKKIIVISGFVGFKIDMVVFHLLQSLKKLGSHLFQERKFLVDEQ